MNYIDEVLLSLGPKLSKSQHSIIIDGDRTISISTLPDALSQIITNLILNSLTHAYDETDSGHIRISVSLDGIYLKLIYSDDGRGIDDSIRSKIFDPFFTTKRGSGGSGLGLHILYNLVTQTLGGGVVCESAPGEGATFTITLPSRYLSAPTPDE